MSHHDEVGNRIVGAQRLIDSVDRHDGTIAVVEAPHDLRDGVVRPGGLPIPIGPHSDLTPPQRSIADRGISARTDNYPDTQLRTIQRVAVQLGGSQWIKHRQQDLTHVERTVGHRRHVTGDVAVAVPLHLPRRWRLLQIGPTIIVELAGAFPIAQMVVDLIPYRLQALTVVQHRCNRAGILICGPLGMQTSQVPAGRPRPPRESVHNIGDHAVGDVGFA